MASVQSTISHHHHTRIKERLRHFLSPDGRRIHIALSPEDAESIRKRLEGVAEPFDVHISGSPEHLDALRKAHSHHEQRCDAFRERYTEVYDQFHDLHHDLDALAEELNRVSERGVQLDASFSKYGYSAHLRTCIQLLTNCGTS